MIVAESWPDGHHFKWSCDESCGFWKPGALTARTAEDEARRYGCTHDGHILRRAIVVVAGPWEPAP